MLCYICKVSMKNNMFDFEHIKKLCFVSDVLQSEMNRRIIKK